MNTLDGRLVSVKCGGKRCKTDSVNSDNCTLYKQYINKNSVNKYRTNLV